MALIACPNCGKQMSDRALACPHCGAVPVSAQTVQPAQSVQPAQTAQPVQPVYTQQPVQPPAAYGGEPFENVLIKGKKSIAGMIVCSVLACLLWIACAVTIGCVIYDFNFADSICEVTYFSTYGLYYYSTLTGGQAIEVYWLNVAVAAAAVLALAGAAIFIAGLGKRIKVTNARIIIKRPFRPSVKLTWDRIEKAAKETDTSFVVLSGEKKYRFENLRNQDEVFGVITDMLSRKSSGTLKMPSVCGVKSTFGKLLRKKTPLIAAAGVVVIGIAAAVLVPVFIGLGVKQVEDVPYALTLKYLRGDYNHLGEYKIIDVTCEGSYSGEWLNGKPYGTGTIKFDGNRYLFWGAEYFTGTWKNGEPRKGMLYSVFNDEITREYYSGEFKYCRAYGQGKGYNYYQDCVIEGEFKNDSLYNGTVTYNDGTVERWKNGQLVD